MAATIIVRRTITISRSNTATRTTTLSIPTHLIRTRLLSSSASITQPLPLPSVLPSRKRPWILCDAVQVIVPAASSITRFTPIRFSSSVNRSDGHPYSPLRPKVGDNPHLGRAPLYPGCDYEHWFIAMKEPGGEGATERQMIDGFIQTLAKVLESEEEAKKKIYKVKFKSHCGFGCVVDEETSYKLKGLPGVLYVSPDYYIDAKNKDYGGKLLVNGEIVQRSPERYASATYDPAGSGLAYKKGAKRKQMKYMQQLLLYRHLRGKSSKRIKPGRFLGLNMCTNKIAVALSGKRSDTASYLGALPINLPVDSITKKLVEWISKHSIEGLVFGCSCSLEGQPFPESVHVVHFVQELSNMRELQGMKYTYQEMMITNAFIASGCKNIESPEHLERVAERCSPVLVLKNYLYMMNSSDTRGRPSPKRCSRVLEAFTEQCTTWGNSIIELEKEIKMVYAPWQPNWDRRFGWIATVASRTARFETDFLPEGGEKKNEREKEDSGHVSDPSNMIHVRGTIGLEDENEKVEEAGAGGDSGSHDEGKYEKKWKNGEKKKKGKGGIGLSDDKSENKKKMNRKVVGGNGTPKEADYGN